jgi:hypothetical protein
MTSIASVQAREQDRIFNAEFSAVKDLRARRIKVRPHRAITPLKVTPRLLAQAIILPVVLCALLWWARPMILDFWRSCVMFWSAELGLPFSLPAGLLETGRHAGRLASPAEGIPMPGTTTLAVTLVATVIAFALSLRMKNASFPLKYPLRIICVVQAFALLYFWLTPSAFPYDLAHHGEQLMTIGYAVMLATPVMLAVGYYILNQSLVSKLTYTALILLFFTIMVPHQVLIQALILKHFSVLFMPVLYICFGAVFDALVFVALYSWAASNAPANATL